MHVQQRLSLTVLSDFANLQFWLAGRKINPQLVRQCILPTSSLFPTRYELELKQIGMLSTSCGPMAFRTGRPAKHPSPRILATPLDIDLVRSRCSGFDWSRHGEVVLQYIEPLAKKTRIFQLVLNPGLDGSCIEDPTSCCASCRQPSVYDKVLQGH